MCVILIGKVKNILKLPIDDAWKLNSDGAGIVIADSVPIVFKGIMKLSDLKECLKSIAAHELISVHFRLATHGEANKENTHPFRVATNSYLMHNGIIGGLGSSGNTGTSDSKHMADILSQIRKCDRVPLLQAVGGKYALVEKRMIWRIGTFTRHSGVWMSNETWLPYATKYGTTKGYCHNNPHKQRYYGDDWEDSHYNWHDEYTQQQATKIIEANKNKTALALLPDAERKHFEQKAEGDDSQLPKYRTGPIVLDHRPLGFYENTESANDDTITENDSRSVTLVIDNNEVPDKSISLFADSGLIQSIKGAIWPKRT